MAITDDQVAALRSYLSAGTDAEADGAERQFRTLARTGRLDGIEVLVYGAFAAAARRRFSPTWTSADIVRFVADFRSSSVEAARRIRARVRRERWAANHHQTRHMVHCRIFTTSKPISPGQHR